MTARLRDLDDTQLDAALRAADPADDRTARAPDRSAMLARVTDARQARSEPDPTRRVRRVRALAWTLPAAVAASVVAVAATGLVGFGQPPATGSDLVLAAQRTESTAGGRVVGSVEVREAPGVGAPGGWDFAFTYSGGDFRARIDEGVRVVRAVGVGGTLYTSDEPGVGFVARSRAVAGDAPGLEEYLGVTAAGRPVGGLVSLLEQTSVVTEQRAAAGVTTYSGTVETDDLQDVGDLPPGASYLARATADEAPEVIAVEADVVADRLVRLELRLVGSTGDGPMDITISTRYAPAPDVTSIAAPARIQPEPAADECRVTLTGDGGARESAGCAPLLQTVDRFSAEHPDSRCLTAGGLPVGSGRELVQCLREEGFDSVAEAWSTYLDAYERSQD